MEKTYKLSFYFTLLFLFCFPAQPFAQEKYNLKTFSNDLRDLAKQPLNWEGTDWLTFFGTAGLTYGTMYIDEYIRESVLENNIYQKSLPVEFGRIWGEPYATLIIGGGLYLHGIVAENKANEKIGYEIGESAIITGLITLTLKYSFGRERPRKNADAFSFSPFSFKNDNFLSINSGHTALGFSLSTVLSKNSSSDIMKAVFYLPAFLTAFSRVYQNHHWFSDVLLGGIIGYVVGDFVTKQHKPKTSNEVELYQNNPIPLFILKIPFN